MTTAHTTHAASPPSTRPAWIVLVSATLLTLAFVGAFTLWPVPIAGGATATTNAAPDDTSTFVSEGGAVEVAQVALWLVSGMLALVLCWTIPAEPAWKKTKGRPDIAVRWFTAWLGVMALLAMLRELDMHVYANPETLGDWGVRYRLDWWVDMGVPIGPKLLWVGVFAVIGAAVIVPMARAWPTLARALRRRPLVLAMGALSGLGLVIGWAWDDLFRQWTSGYGPYVEELAELMGSWAYLVAVGLLLWRR